jgi:hypothetical protein
MAFNPAQKLAGNIAAVLIALDWDGKRKLTGVELNSLKGYAGFGGIKAVLFGAGSREEWVAKNASEADLRLYPQVMELHKLLQDHLDEKVYKQTIDALQHSALTAFYTPDLIPRALYFALNEQGILPERLYEPSAGAGVFITEALPFFDLKQINAVEKDVLTGKVLAAICSALPVPAQVQVKGLEETPARKMGSMTSW